MLKSIVFVSRVKIPFSTMPLCLELGAGIGGEVRWTVLVANNERLLVATCVPIGLFTVGEDSSSAIENTCKAGLSMSIENSLSLFLLVVYPVTLQNKSMGWFQHQSTRATVLCCSRNICQECCSRISSVTRKYCRHAYQTSVHWLPLSISSSNCIIS